MNKIIKDDIIKVLARALDILNNEPANITELKELSNHTIHNASIFQDKDSVSIALIIYSLSKIFERGQTIDDVKYLFKDAFDSLKNNNFSEYQKIIQDLFKVISVYDNKFSAYIEEVITQAEIKKSSKLYEHGLSLGRASEILGISKWELMSYIGNTKINDVEDSKVDVVDRIKFTKTLFNIK